MVAASRKILFLTGAPLPSSLKWTEDELTAKLQSCYRRIGTSEGGIRPTPEGIAPLWRFLPLKQNHLPTGLTQGSNEDDPSRSAQDSANEASCFTPSDTSFISDIFNKCEDQVCQDSLSDLEQKLSQYYEHSFAVHDEAPSSQILSSDSMTETSFSISLDQTSIDLTTNHEISSQEQLARSRLVASCLSDIRDMPNAAYLRSISPQTMTTNLVIGIISISQPRTIQLRKGGRVVELVEMLVGDDTRAGFGINVWLQYRPQFGHATGEPDCLRSSISQLRSQDILFMRNVALSSFRGIVHGQSLRKGMTTVDLLYRSTIDINDAPGLFTSHDLDQDHDVLSSQMSKVKRVKEWVMQFIGSVAQHVTDVTSIAPMKTQKQKLRALPLDTQ